MARDCAVVEFGDTRLEVFGTFYKGCPATEDCPEELAEFEISGVFCGAADVTNLLAACSYQGQPALDYLAKEAWVKVKEKIDVQKSAEGWGKKSFVYFGGWA